LDTDPFLFCLGNAPVEVIATETPAESLARLKSARTGRMIPIQSQFKMRIEQVPRSPVGGSPF